MTHINTLALRKQRDKMRAILAFELLSSSDDQTPAVRTATQSPDEAAPSPARVNGAATQLERV